MNGNKDFKLPMPEKDINSVGKTAEIMQKIKQSFFDTLFTMAWAGMMIDNDEKKGEYKKMNQQLYEDIKYGTNVIPEEEYLESLLYVADVASEMVVKTLGPYGKTTMLHDGNVVYPTKDGWSVLRSIKWSDPIFNTIYSVLQQVSFDLVSKVGDGTTTAFVGANIFLHELIDYTTGMKKFRQADFLNKLTEIADCIIEQVSTDKYVKKINPNGDFEDIYRIAYVASNGNEELARMIQDIYLQTGNPNIYVTLDPYEKMKYTIQKGYKFDCKVLKQQWYRNGEDGTYVENSNTDVYIFDHNVGFQNHQFIINGALNYSNSRRRVAVIMAPHFDDVMLNVLTTQMQSLVNQGQMPSVLLVQIPLSGADILKQYLSDVVLLTNAQIIDYGKVRAFNALTNNLNPENEKIDDAILNTAQYKGKTPEEIIAMVAGTTHKLVAGEKYILIQDYEGIVNQRIYQETMTDVKNKYLELKEKAEKSSNMLQKDYMDAYQHYTKLNGNLGVIYVGAPSFLEKRFLKDVVDDAVLACRSAFDNGYIRGLNLATLSAIKDLAWDWDGSRSIEEISLLMMFEKVFTQISEKVLENKNPGFERISVTLPDKSTNKLSNQEIIMCAVANNWGYDIVNDTFMEDDDCYIVNSVKTDIEIIRGMISILSTVLTSNQFLSINRSYDRQMGQKQRAEMIQRQKVEDAKAMTSAIVDVMKDMLPEGAIETFTEIMLDRYKSSIVK